MAAVREDGGDKEEK